MKTVLITGANRGIGLEIANQYWAEGWRVVACRRTLKDLKKKERWLDIQLDVTDWLQIQQLAQKMEGEKIDFLINNAGVSGPANEEINPLDNLTWFTVFQVNTVAPYMVAKALSGRKKRGSLGLIVNMSSSYGSIELNKSDYNHCIYRASKAALNALTKCLANEFPRTIVISMHPGSVITDMNPEGTISSQESVCGMRKVFDSLTLKESGSFFKYTREILPW